MTKEEAMQMLEDKLPFKPVKYTKMEALLLGSEPRFASDTLEACVAIVQELIGPAWKFGSLVSVTLAPSGKRLSLRFEHNSELVYINDQIEDWSKLNPAHPAQRYKVSEYEP